MAEACQKTDWQVHPCCLMSNHFHLVVETPNANLVEGMRWLHIGEELQRRNWGESALVERRKGDPEKLAIAVRLRQETSLSLKRLAARLHLGPPRAAGERLREWLQQHALSAVERQAELGL